MVGVGHYLILVSPIQLEFRAYDSEHHVLDTRLGVEVQIKDANDNTPKFEAEKYEISIEESTLQGKWHNF